MVGIHCNPLIRAIPLCYKPNNAISDLGNLNGYPQSKLSPISTALDPVAPSIPQGRFLIWVEVVILTAVNLRLLLLLRIKDVTIQKCSCSFYY